MSELFISLLQVAVKIIYNNVYLTGNLHVLFLKKTAFFCPFYSGSKVEFLFATQKKNWFKFNWGLTVKQQQIVRDIYL